MCKMASLLAAKVGDMTTVTVLLHFISPIPQTLQSSKGKKKCKNDYS